MSQQKEECSICLEEMGVPEDVVRLPSCKHVFHTQCFFEHMKAHHQGAVACPLCRGSVVVLPMPPPVVMEPATRVLVIQEEEGERERTLRSAMLLMTCGLFAFLVFSTCFV